MLQIKTIFFIPTIFCLCLVYTITGFADNRKNTQYVEPGTGIEFVYVQGGCYKMGDIFGDGDIDELPVHEVCVDDFYLGKYEVTNAQFRQFIMESGYKTIAEGYGKGYAISKEGADDRKLQKGVNWEHPLWPSDNIAKKENHPVVQVCWRDTEIFIKWLNRKSVNKFRLPTEAEWEYAARSRGKKYEYSWGNGKPTGNIADESVKEFRKYKNWRIWDGYKDGYVYTSPAGKFKANDIGICDMAGNVAEWCSDFYNTDYYKISSKNNPKGDEHGPERSVRGGSWNFKPHFLRSANRINIFPNTWTYYLGFRVAMTPPNQKDGNRDADRVFGLPQ
ncbi:MAG: formylglycine-generating enzyme family protein [Candidatus Anammoxibacter sp.]